MSKVTTPCPTVRPVACEPARPSRRPLLAGGLLLAGGVASWPVRADPTKGRKVKVNMASVYPPGSPLDVGLGHFKAAVEKQTGGRIEVAIHRSGAMGDEKQTFEMLSQGSVEMGALGTGDIAIFFPRHFISEVPYLFSSQQDFWAFWNGPGKDLSALIEQRRGVKTHGVIYRGARYLTSNRPIENVAAVKGLKMRLPPIKAWFRTWEALGAVPSTIAFSEVYMALKTGVVEAQENPPETILAYKMYEAQKYLIATEHVYGAARIMSSKSWWDGLSKDDRALLDAALADATAHGNEITKDGDAAIVKQLQGLGMTLQTIDKSAFKKAVQPVTDEMAAKEWDQGFYAKVKAIL